MIISYEVTRTIELFLITEWMFFRSSSNVLFVFSVLCISRADSIHVKEWNQLILRLMKLASENQPVWCQHLCDEYPLNLLCTLILLLSYSVFHSTGHNLKRDSCSSKLYIYTQRLARYHDVINVFSCHKVLICVINRCSQHESLMISHSKTSVLQNMVLIV